MQNFKRVFLAGFMVLLLGVPVVGATKFPSIRFQVRGVIKDWETKQPIKDVHLIIFLNDASYTDNNGWVPDNDFPHFPSTDEKGQFSAAARLYRGQEIEINKIEVIAFHERYRSERFVFLKPKVSALKEGGFAPIDIGEISLLKTNIKSDLVDEQTANTKILSFKAVAQSNDQLTVDVEYEYAKEDGDQATLGAITLLDGHSTGYWAYHAVLIESGHHSQRVTIGMSKEAKENYHSNGIEIFIYSKQGSLARRDFSFDKDWSKITNK